MKTTTLLKIMVAVVMLTISIGAMVMTGCTENTRARNWGGTYHYDVLPCTKVVNVTWKNVDLWVLTRPLRPGEALETWTFSEDSNAGILNGTVLLRENCARSQ